MFTKVYKEDLNHNVVEIYKSVKECQEKNNITENHWYKYILKNIPYKGFYYRKEEKTPYYIEKECPVCGKLFMTTQARIGKLNISCCSYKCSGIYRKTLTPPNTQCVICGKPLHVKPEYLTQQHTCSPECLKEMRKQRMSGENNHQYGLKGKLNASWKSDERINTRGYKCIRVLSHPFKNKAGFVLEHRLIAEKYLLNENNSTEIDGKRYLKKEYTVHHIDMNRLNNDINNLYVMTRKDHTRFHKSLTVNIKDTSGKIISVKKINYSSTELREKLIEFINKQGLNEKHDFNNEHILNKAI